MGIVCAPSALAQSPRSLLSGPATQPTEHIEIADVALQDGGALMGQVVTTEGKLQADASVTIQRNGQTLVVTVTDAEGKYAAQGLSGGVYQVVVGNTTATYRLWAQGTAPPSARPVALLIDGSTVVRGQTGSLFLARPWLVTAGVASGIAVPIAITNGKGGS